MDSEANQNDAECHVEEVLNHEAVAPMPGPEEASVEHMPFSPDMPQEYENLPEQHFLETPPSEDPVSYANTPMPLPPIVDGAPLDGFANPADGQQPPYLPFCTDASSMGAAASPPAIEVPWGVPNAMSVSAPLPGQAHGQPQMYGPRAMPPQEYGQHQMYDPSTMPPQDYGQKRMYDQSGMPPQAYSQQRTYDPSGMPPQQYGQQHTYGPSGMPPQPYGQQRMHDQPPQAHGPHQMYGPTAVPPQGYTQQQMMGSSPIHSQAHHQQQYQPPQQVHNDPDMECAVADSGDTETHQRRSRLTKWSSYVPTVRPPRLCRLPEPLLDKMHAFKIIDTS